MKIFKMPKLAELNPEGEHCLAIDAASPEALRFTYGRLHKDMTGKRLNFPPGTHGYFYVIKGNVTVKTAKASFLIGPGEAFHSKEAADYTLDNSCNSAVEYIFATAAVSAERGLSNSAQSKPAQNSNPAIPSDPINEKAAKPHDDGFLITKEDADPSGISN